MTTSRVLSTVTIGALVAAGILSSPLSASADAITVTNSNDAGDGSLRQAILDSQSGDIITFAADVTSIVLDSELVIGHSLTVQGPDLDRVMLSRGTPEMQYIEIVPTAASVDVTLSGLSFLAEDGDVGSAIVASVDEYAVHDLTLANVDISDQSSESGAAVNVVEASGTVTLDSVDISGNTASVDGGGVLLGSVNDVAITNSSFDGNLAANLGGALSVVSANGSIDIDGSEFQGNQAAAGGAIALADFADDSSITTSLFLSNTAAGDPAAELGAGGAIYANGVTNAALDISTTAFAFNYAFVGGAVSLRGVTDDGSATLDANVFFINGAEVEVGMSVALSEVSTQVAITNTTFLNATAFGSQPGSSEILAYAINGDGAATNLLLDHLTVVGGPLATLDDEGTSLAIVDVENTAVDTYGSPVASIVVGENYDLSVNYSLFSDADGYPEGTGNGFGVTDFGMTAFGEWGGSLPTNYPTSGSPLIDAGDPAYSGTAFDGRGGEYPRIAYGRTDIGAVEYDEPFFADVPTAAGFFDAIQWMYLTNLSTGTVQPEGKPLFKPTSAVSRQAMASFLFRYDGEQQADATEQTFADVPVSSPFATAIEWLATLGYATGTAQPSGLPLFKPTDALSRQSLAIVLARYAGVDVSTAPTSQAFADVPVDSVPAAAIDWMSTQQISTGTAQPSGLPLYKPLDSLSRQALAAFLYRYANPPQNTSSKLNAVADGLQRQFAE